MEQSQEPGVKGQRSPRWAFMSKMEIPSKKNDGELYLVRLRIVQTPWFGVYLHNINEPDFDRDPHDHPWNFLSFIVRGGYTERIWARPADRRLGSYQRRWNRFTWHRMTMEKAHQIEEVQPNTVSLILTGPRTRNWGFWTEDGWVEWREYEHLVPDWVEPKVVPLNPDWRNELSE